MHRIKIHDDKVINVLRGGIGASWHSISHKVPFNNADYDYPARLTNPRGSAVGGNPPVEWEDQWNQLFQHASWLGINWLRVELTHHMYEPERNVFDWDNNDMQALYKILDWCELQQADVFLQQMWTEVAWNAYPHVHPLISAPFSLDDYAEGIRTLLDHLINHKGYTCIKYFCITNEPPGGTWGYWWSHGSGSGSGSVLCAWKKVRKTLDKHNIDVPLAGPDWTDLPPFAPEKIDFDEYIGAYDIHAYQGIDGQGADILRQWASWAHQCDKPFFLIEFGNMGLGWGTDSPAPKSFAAAMSNAEAIIRGLNVGVDAFNRWSFTNRGDMDGQWQLVKTWDRKEKYYVKQVHPEVPAYVGFGIISRFLPKYATVLTTECRPAADKKILCAALKSLSGEVIIYIINKSKNVVQLELETMTMPADVSFYHYFVDENALNVNNFLFGGSQLQLLNKNTLKMDLKPKSIHTITTYNLKPDDVGIVQ
jgi:hypothetical protein